MIAYDITWWLRHTVHGRLESTRFCFRSPRFDFDCFISNNRFRTFVFINSIVAGYNVCINPSSWLFRGDLFLFWNHFLVWFLNHVFEFRYFMMRVLDFASCLMQSDTFILSLIEIMVIYWGSLLIFALIFDCSALWYRCLPTWILPYAVVAWQPVTGCLLGGECLAGLWFRRRHWCAPFICSWFFALFHLVVNGSFYFRFLPAISLPASSFSVWFWLIWYQFFKQFAVNV